MLRSRLFSVALCAAMMGLATGCPSDGGDGDLLNPPDLTLRPDLTQPLDLQSPADLTTTGDLQVPPDFSAPPDLSVPPDLSGPPDLTVPPDLSGPADLTVPPDLSGPPDLSLPGLSITSIEPDNGLATVATAVTVRGTAFVNGTTLQVGNNLATVCTFIDSTQLDCTAPLNVSGVQMVNVIVTNPGGESATRTDGFRYTGVLNDRTPARDDEADYCNLQYPPTIPNTNDPAPVIAGQPTPQIYSQIYEVPSGSADYGNTPAPGADPRILAEVGYGPTNADPTTQAGWLFFVAAYNELANAGNNDEYNRTLTVPTAGNYSYTYRYSFDGGLNYTYCDIDGAGQNSGLDFSAAQLGQLTVSPAP